MTSQDMNRAEHNSEKKMIANHCLDAKMFNRLWKIFEPVEKMHVTSLLQLQQAHAENALPDSKT